MADDGGHAGGAPAAPAAPAAPSASHGPAEALAVNAKNQKNNNTPNSPVLEEIASLTSPRLFTPNPFSRKNTSLDIDDYFVCARRAWVPLSVCQPTNASSRPVLETSRSTRNGPSSSRCTGASCPSSFFRSWPSGHGRRGSPASTCWSSQVRLLHRRCAPAQCECVCLGLTIPRHP